MHSEKLLISANLGTSDWEETCGRIINIFALAVRVKVTVINTVIRCWFRRLAVVKLPTRHEVDADGHVLVVIAHILVHKS